MAAISSDISYSCWQIRRKFLRAAVCAMLFCCFALATGGQRAFAAPVTQDLKVYFVDVEGGQATLFVTPEGQSLLIDTGWSGNHGRDADRIVAAAKDAGIVKIDYVLITHFHEDHVGGLLQLVARIPVSTFIDHGDNRWRRLRAAATSASATRPRCKTGKRTSSFWPPGNIND